MKVLVWNCCSFENSQAVPTLHLLVRQEIPNMVCLMEMKLSAIELEKIKWKLHFAHGFGVGVDGRKGSLGMLGYANVKVELKSYNLNLIDCHILNEVEEVQWHFTLFYGDPVARNKDRMWRILKDLNNSSRLPWVVGGDFNEILSA